MVGSPDALGASVELAGGAGGSGGIRRGRASGYLLVLAGQKERARSLLEQARTTLDPRYPNGHPAGALTQLTRAAGRNPRLPLAPSWFGF